MLATASYGLPSVAQLLSPLDLLRAASDEQAPSSSDVANSLRELERLASITYRFQGDPSGEPFTEARELTMTLSAVEATLAVIDGPNSHAFLTELATRYPGQSIRAARALKAAVVKLRDLRTALMFVLDMDDEEADADFALPDFGDIAPGPSVSVPV